MDAFVTAAAEAAIERAQTGAASGVRIKIGAHLDDTADSTVFLGKEQCATKRIPGGTIDAVESSQTIRIAWCQKRDAMIGMRHIKIDSRDVERLVFPLAFHVPEKGNAGHNHSPVWGHRDYDPE